MTAQRPNDGGPTVRRTCAALALLLLTACSGDAKSERADTITATPPSPTASATPTPTPSRASKVATTAQLRAALLAVDDMPTGWSTEQDDEDDDDSFSEGCKPLAALDEAFEDDTDEPEVLYAQGELGPFVNQAIGSLPSAAEVSKRMAALKAALGKCPSFQYTDDEGDTQKVRIAPVSFPRLGDETLASRLTVEFEGGTLSMTVLAIRVRNHAMLLTGMSVTTVFGGGQLTPADLERIARTAVTKAEKRLP